MIQAILKCLPLLADVLGRAYGVTVEIGGNDAYTTGRVIRLPGLPAVGDPPSSGWCVATSITKRPISGTPISWR